MQWIDQKRAGCLMSCRRREEAARTTRRHTERQRSFSRLYQAARAGIARPAGAHRAQAWKEGEAALC